MVLFETRIAVTCVQLPSASTVVSCRRTTVRQHLTCHDRFIIARVCLLRFILGPQDESAGSLLDGASTIDMAHSKTAPTQGSEKMINMMLRCLCRDTRCRFKQSAVLSLSQMCASWSVCIPWRLKHGHVVSAQQTVYMFVHPEMHQALIGTRFVYSRLASEHNTREARFGPRHAVQVTR